MNAVALVTSSSCDDETSLLFVPGRKLDWRGVDGGYFFRCWRRRVRPLPERKLRSSEKSASLNPQSTCSRLEKIDVA